MKIKKLKSKQLLKLHLLKSRVYEHSSKKTNLMQYEKLKVHVMPRNYGGI